MKNNLSYYPHDADSHNHWKFKLLRKKYKWEGEGKFWALNNEVAKAENCTLNLNDEGRKMGLVSDLDFDTVEEFDAWIFYMRDACRLIKWIDGWIQTDITQSTLQEVSEDRIRKREWMRQKRSGNVATTGQPQDVQTENVDDNKNSVYDQIEQRKKENKESKSTTDLKSKDVSKRGANAPTETGVSERELGEQYRQIADDPEKVKAFILEKKPCFIFPYARLWNAFAEKNGFPQVKTLNETRRKKIRTRCREQPFDFVAIVEKAEQTNFDLTKNWLTFDWLIENANNYVKLLEGNYDRKNGKHKAANSGGAAENSKRDRNAGAKSVLEDLRNELAGTGGEGAYSAEV